jgi:hypothetical protein
MWAKRIYTCRRRFRFVCVFLTGFSRSMGKVDYVNDGDYVLGGVAFALFSGTLCLGFFTPSVGKACQFIKFGAGPCFCSDVLAKCMISVMSYNFLFFLGQKNIL